MTRRGFDRRRFGLGLGAALAAAGPSLAAVIMRGSGSRIVPRSDAPYLPPTNISSVADIYKRMTVPILVNGQGPFAFVVDTGANQSVISGELAAQLGLSIGELEPLHGVAGLQMAPTTVAHLAVGRRLQASVTLSVLPAAAIGAAGMLGLDRLEGQRLTLDFAQQELRIGAAQDGLTAFGDIAVKATRRDGQLTLVDADLAGISLIAFIDSGAQSTIGNLALRDLAITRNPKTLWSSTPIISATGQEMMAEMADLPKLRVGGMGLPNWPVAFADLHTFQMWRLTHRPAILLGVDILSRFRSVCLDFPRGEVRFRLPLPGST